MNSNNYSRILDNVCVIETMLAMDAYQQRYTPKGWKPARWAVELDRRAKIADKSHPKIAETFRRWAAEVRDIADKRAAFKARVSSKRQCCQVARSKNTAHEPQTKHG